MADDTEDFILSIMGEGFHTALRKATESPQSSTAWIAIAGMPERDWEAVLQFVLDGMRTSGIELTVTRSGDG